MRSDASVMGGTLVFRSSRVPAQSLLDYLDDEYNLDEFLEMFPSVDREDAVEFLRLARGTKFDAVVSATPGSCTRVAPPTGA